MEEESKHEEPTEEEEAQEEVAEKTLEKEEEAPETVEAEEEELPPTEEEVKPRRPKEVEEEFVEERIYTIPLGKAWIAPPRKRAPRAMKIIRNFVKRHMKLEKTITELEEEEEPKRLIISNDVNDRVWTRGIQKPPRRVRVRAAKDKDGNITVFLAE